MSYLNDWWRVFFGGMEYPYTDSRRYNDDWVLEVAKKLIEEFDNFVNLNKIKYADPIGWDITRQYEANTVVVDNRTGNAYISSRPVPAGVQISNTNYWTEIYNYANVIDTLREQIAFNEGDTTTASKAFEVGELIFVNGLLYRVIAPMIAGDSFVVDSNVVKTTVEKELKRLITSIAGEALVRQEADEALQDNINTEALARQEADEALQENINAEILEREKISHIVYTTNYDSFSDIIAALTDDSILCLNSTVNITGVTGVINAPIICTADGVFSGTPTSLTINNQDILPRWFGAKKADSTFNNTPAIQNAIKACPRGGRVYLEKGEYYISTPIVINKVITFSGDRDGTTITCGNNNVSPLITISGTTSNYLDGAVIKDLVLGKYAQHDNSIGLYVTLSANTLIQNIRSANFVNCFKFKFTTSTRIEGCIALNTLGQAFYGYLLDCTEDSPISILSSNGSFYLNNCACNAVGNSAVNTGFYVTGKDMRDIYLNGFETANCNYGINIDGNSTAFSTDILITNCVLDRCKNIGLRVKGLPSQQAGVKVSNTFISIDETQTVEHCIKVENANNVTIDNCELYCMGVAFSAIALMGAERCSVNNVTFNSPAYAIVVASNSQCNVISNIFIKRTTSYECAVLIQGNYNIINNVVMQALFTIGVNITGNNNVLFNYISRGNTTSYSDTGTGNQIDNVI